MNALGFAAGVRGLPAAGSGGSQPRGQGAPSRGVRGHPAAWSGVTQLRSQGAPITGSGGTQLRGIDSKSVLLLIESTSQGYVLSCLVLSCQVSCFLCVVVEGLVETGPAA